ncbi:MAG: hypothetical protein AB7V45_11190 [Candidatus Krumholzibacteriia bacterium]
MRSAVLITLLVVLLPAGSLGWEGAEVLPAEGVTWGRVKALFKG